MAPPQEGPQESNESSKRYLDVIRRYRPGQILSVQREEGCVRFTTNNGVELAVRPVTPTLFRMTYLTVEDREHDFSYAVDPDFDPPAVAFEVEETEDCVSVSTGELELRIGRTGLLAAWHAPDGTLLCEDHLGFSSRQSLVSGPTKVSVSQKVPEEAAYYGLGDKAAALNLRGQRFVNWNTDAFEYERGDDPLYRSIPFFLALNGGRAHGIFMDNTYRSNFDFDSKGEGVLRFSAEGGVMDYYFIYGPGLTEVAERYARLTGTPHLPPLWALGYHQCRWSYYPESEVRQLAEDFREREIPCDALYLDIDYMDGYRCFTWNRDHFPDPAGMIADLREQGFRTVVMIDPGIKADPDYEVYRQGTERDLFCKRADGETFLGPVWPGRCAFPDFTDPAARQWWGDCYREFMAELDVAGIWNDMNEPALFELKQKTFPEEIRHRYDGHPCSHRKAHNIYGMQMARASLEGMKRHAPERRPFLLSRAGFSGAQRYAALWTGDNTASWDHLRLAHEQCLRLSISGFSFVGTDIGGFVDEPDGELFARWMQLSAFHPLFRSHTMGYNEDGAGLTELSAEELMEKNTAARQEPWSFGEPYTAINRKAIELRYRLLDYLYTAFYRYIRRGTPVLRPAAFEAPSDAGSVGEEEAFLFGDHLLVLPVLREGARRAEAFLPPGEWFHFQSGRKYAGGEMHTVDAPLEEIPFFVRGGGVLPLREVMQYTGQREREQLELRLYCSESAAPVSSTLFEDAGDGWGYREEAYRLTRFEYRCDAEQGLRLTASRQGDFRPEYDRFELTLAGLPFEPDTVSVDGEDLEPEPEAGGRYRLLLDPGFRELRLK